MYGLTEAFRSTSLDPALVDEHPDSVGEAIPFAEVMIVREDGSEAGPDEEGELVHAGPLVAQGYWQDPGAHCVSASSRRRHSRATAARPYGLAIGRFGATTV